MVHAMSLGERIEALRKEIGISQAELARRVGVRQSTMNSLIKGNSRTTRSLVAIARELRTTPAYLSGETDDPDADLPDVDPNDAAWLEQLHSLTPEDREAVLQLMGSLTSRRKKPTVRERQSEGRRDGAK